jgi:hypothetical protein
MYYPIWTFQLIGAERSPIVQSGDYMSGRQGISAPISYPASPGLMRWVAGSPAYGCRRPGARVCCAASSLHLAVIGAMLSSTAAAGA